MARKRATTQASLERVMRELGVRDHLAHASARILYAGARAKGTISLHDALFGEDLDVDVDIHVRQVVTKHEQGGYRDQALALLVRQPWRDHCCATIKRRDAWQISKHNRECSKPVTTALVLVVGERVHFSFSCTVHAKTEGEHAAITDLHWADLEAVRVEQRRIRVLNEKRERDEELPHPRFLREDDPEIDISIERVLRRSGRWLGAPAKNSKTRPSRR